MLRVPNVESNPFTGGVFVYRGSARGAATHAEDAELPS